MNCRVLHYRFSLVLVLVFLAACGASEATPEATPAPPIERPTLTPTPPLATIQALPMVEPTTAAPAESPPTPGLSPQPSPTPKSEPPKSTPSPGTLVPLPVSASTSPWAFGSREESLPGWLGRAEEAAIAVDREGVLHAIWWADVGASGDRTYPIFYANRHPGGAGAWSETVEISADNAPAEEPWGRLAIALDSHNIPHVMWGKDNRVFYATQAPDGSWSVAEVVEPTACSDCHPGPPVIAIDREDRIQLVWTERTNLMWSSKDPDGEWSSALEISNGIVPRQAGGGLQRSEWT